MVRAMRKGRFLTPLVTEDLNDGVHFRLVKPLVYVAKNGRRYVVPTGFVTDFFSIPPVIRALLPKSEKGNRAAVLHDAAYQGVIDVPTRGAADCLLLEAMEACDVRWTRRHLIYRGVRLGGWASYRRKQKHPCSTNSCATS